MHLLAESLNASTLRKNAIQFHLNNQRLEQPCKSRFAELHGFMQVMRRTVTYCTAHMSTQIPTLRPSGSRPPATRRSGAEFQKHKDEGSRLPRPPLVAQTGASVRNVDSGFWDSLRESESLQKGPTKDSRMLSPSFQGSDTDLLISLVTFR